MKQTTAILFLRSSEQKTSIPLFFSLPVRPLVLIYILVLSTCIPKIKQKTKLLLFWVIYILVLTHFFFDASFFFFWVKIICRITHFVFLIFSADVSHCYWLKKWLISTKEITWKMGRHSQQEYAIASCWESSALNTRRENELFTGSALVVNNHLKYLFTAHSTTLDS